MQGATFTMASDCGSTPTPGSSIPIFATQVDQAATAATVASFQPQINHLFDLQNQVTDFCLFSYYKFRFLLFIICLFITLFITD